MIANDSPKSTGGMYGDLENDKFNILVFNKDFHTWSTE